MITINGTWAYVILMLISFAFGYGLKWLMVNDYFDKTEKIHFKDLFHDFFGVEGDRK